MSRYCPGFDRRRRLAAWLHGVVTADQADQSAGSAAMVVAWQRLDSSVVHTTPWFDVRSDSIIGPDGERDTVAYAVSPGSVTVLAVDEDDTVILTRRWIYVHGGTEWRLPGGPVPTGETDYPAVAHRALATDTGLRAARLNSIGVVHGADSVCAHVDRLFLATGLTSEHPAAGRQMRRLSFSDAVELVLDGQLPHAGSSHALLATALNRDAQNRH
jgi:ADP-ribose pyrophosphatase YjhB (NUDIX family)